MAHIDEALISGRGLRVGSIMPNQSVGMLGRGGSLVESMSFGRRVADSNPALDATYRDLGQILHLQLPVGLRRVNSYTVSTAVVGSASERLVL